MDISYLSDHQNLTGEERVLFVCATATDANILQQSNGGSFVVGNLGRFVFATPSIPRSEAAQQETDLAKKVNETEFCELDFDQVIGYARKNHELSMKSDQTDNGGDKLSEGSLDLPEHVIQMLSILRELQKDPRIKPFFGGTGALPGMLDLNEVTKRVVLGLYSSVKLFADDIRTVWRNAKDSHPINSVEYTASSQLSAYFEELLAIVSTKNEKPADHGGSSTEAYSFRQGSESDSDLLIVPYDDSGYRADEDDTQRKGESGYQSHVLYSTAKVADGDDYGEDNSDDTDNGWTTQTNSKSHEKSKSVDNDNTILPKDNSITLVCNGRYSKTIRISRISIAQHLSQILKWLEECRGTGVELENMSSSEPISDMFLALDVGNCSIEVLIDKHKRKQKVQAIRSPDDDLFLFNYQCLFVRWFSWA